MEPDCYQVEVLYHLNPHLIWIEVVDPKRIEEFYFEQVGIYGILPYETTIEDCGEGLKKQRCSEWVQAANVLMKVSLLKAKDTWFRPTHIDRRNSIFDDNIHKYGELLLKISDNEIVQLSEVLIQAGFALYDTCLFHQELSLGNFKTKLSSVTIKDVIKHLEKDNTNLDSRKDRQKSVNKQTTVFHAAQNLESSLTLQNIDRHNNAMDLKGATIDKLLENKMKDLDKCKDFEEESVGRGSFLKKCEAGQRIPAVLRKKLEISKTQKNKPSNEHWKNLSDPSKVLLATKQFLETNVQVCDDSDSNLDANKLNASEMFDTGESVKHERKNSNQFALRLKKKSQNDEKVLKQVEQNKLQAKNYEAEKIVEYNEDAGKKKITSNKGKTHKRSRKVPEYDIESEMRIAYGPPESDRSVWPLKIVPKIKDDDEKLVVTSVDDRQEMVENDDEMFEDVDSSINLQISNVDILKEKVLVNAANETIEGNIDQDDSSHNESNTTVEPVYKVKNTRRSLIFQKRLQLHKDISRTASSITSTSDTTVKDSSSSVEDKPTKEKTKTGYLDSDDDTMPEIIEKVNKEYSIQVKKKEVEETKDILVANDYKVVNVNPFKNIDASISVFVDKLVTPVLMVHSKMNKRIEPSSSIRDVNFNPHIHMTLKNMTIERPMMLQMISWPVILRGYSLFMISPLGSGKTWGYLPAVCRLITGFKSDNVDSVGPTCIIVCATAQSVSDVEKLARMFLGVDEKVLSCYVGIDELHVTTSLLNGCDLFICTPCVLVRLLQVSDFGVDLRRLNTFVLEDCERLAEVYTNEVKYLLVKIKEMLKSRANKELKVQYVVASRTWCDLLEPLAKRAPNTVICIGAFQECVLYSKANTTFDYVKKENKVSHVLEFLKDIDQTKRTVIVCRSDKEVAELGNVLKEHKYVHFSCNSTMTVEDLYSLSKTWAEYQEPVLGPVLICCDGNLNHLNVCDAHYLVHFSLPQLFSMFCKRFSVLNDNYPSIFNEKNDTVKIKILLEEGNVEQLPKIFNFVKRCTTKVPEFLDNVCDKILHEKEAIKGKNCVPICDNMLALGDCPDFWNCRERHAVFKEYDSPKDWMPSRGMITFKILHFHSAARYSARLLSNSVGGHTKNYPKSTLPLKMGMYFSKESNRQLLGSPNIGDICAVSVKQNFFVRCQVIKILSYYKNGTPNWVLIKLIDEEKLEKVKDIYLFYLPDELKNIESHVVQVRLANVRPKDRDITFSELARDQLKKITEKDDDMYMRGQVVLTLGNCIYIDTLDVCQELTSLKEIVVRFNVKKELLDAHGLTHPDHITKLQTLCRNSDLIKEVEQDFEVVKIKRMQPKPQWAHLEKDDLSSVFFASCDSPGTFFVRHSKFETCMKLLVKEIDKYLEDPVPVDEVNKGDIVLAQVPGDTVHDRARIDDILDDGKVKCFFVDHGDWKNVPVKDLVQIPDKYITQMPFQAIECSLIGVKPAGDDWTEFGTNWFYDNCYETDKGVLKQLYVKYFTKQKADHTDGNKYGVVVVDTNSDQDVVINQLMIDLNLAQENEEETHFLDSFKFAEAKMESNSDRDTDEDNCGDVSKTIVPIKTFDANDQPSLNDIFLKKPIRSVPLVDSDNESEASDKWDVGNPADFAAGLRELIPGAVTNSTKPEPVVVNKEKSVPKLPVIKNILDSIQIQKNTTKDCNSTLDSDDTSSNQSLQLSENTANNQTTSNIAVDSTVNTISANPVDDLRKPKLVWRQNKLTVSIKIQLIGADDYRLEVKDRSIDFTATCNDTRYGFQFDLYGVIDQSAASHANKGQYIFVKLSKVMKKNWLTLTRDGKMRKWIVYDVDGIDISSDEEEEVPNPLADVVKNCYEGDKDSDSEDDDFIDDMHYEYKRDSD